MYFVLLGEWSPHEYVIHSTEKTFQFFNRATVIAVQNIEVIAVRETYQGSLLVILVRFSRFLEAKFFGKKSLIRIRTE